MNDIEKIIEDRRNEVDNPLRQAQLVMLRLLRIVDYICRENDLRYWLDSGTLLGAVRHNGFIPWDDDIDICMPRDDYEKFIKSFINHSFNSVKLELRTSDKYSRLNPNPCKIRDQWSVYIEPGSNNKSENLGIFLDIFPYDKYHSNGLISYCEKFIKNTYLIIVKLKESVFYSEQSRSRSVLAKFNGIWVLLFRTYLCVTKPLIKRSKKISDFDSLWGFGYDVPFCWFFNERDIFPLKEVVFENYKFYAPNDCHRYLSRFYGNSFMELPPEEKRKSHAIKIIPDIRK